MIEKTAHSTIKAVYTISNRKHPDQEKTFQNIYFKDPRTIKGEKPRHSTDLRRLVKNVIRGIKEITFWQD